MPTYSTEVLGNAALRKVVRRGHGASGTTTLISRAWIPYLKQLQSRGAGEANSAGLETVAGSLHRQYAEGPCHRQSRETVSEEQGEDAPCVGPPGAGAGSSCDRGGPSFRPRKPSGLSGPLPGSRTVACSLQPRVLSAQLGSR